jgi:cation diffusion facilitator family transporter
MSPENREKILWARLSIVSNSVLTAMKVVVGILTFSISIISEAVHSGIDLVASGIAAYSVQKAAQPADKDHKFGHGKFENISGLFESMLILVAAVIIIYEAGLKIFEGPILHVIELGILVMLVSVVVNILVSRKLYEVARRTDSIALEADAAHLRADVWTSLGVLLGLGAIRLGQLWGVNNLLYLDPIVAIFVAGIIIYVAVKLTKRSFVDLTDVSLPEDEEKAIERIIEDHWSQYIEFHKMRSRKAGAERHIDLHLVVSKNVTVDEAHSLAEHIETDIQAEFPGSQVLIHVEPCDGECDMCKKTKVECD